jgi:uncharacterized DUF497 family protein
VRIIPNPEKEAINRRKHGLDFSRVEEMLAGVVVDYWDDRRLGYEHEGRIRVLGQFDRRVHVLVFELIEIEGGLVAAKPISLRKAQPRERREFERVMG